VGEGSQPSPVAHSNLPVPWILPSLNSPAYTAPSEYVYDAACPRAERGGLCRWSKVAGSGGRGGGVTAKVSAK